MKPQQVLLVVKGGDYSQADLNSLAAAAEDANDPALLELAWEVGLHPIMLLPRPAPPQPHA